MFNAGRNHEATGGMTLLIFCLRDNYTDMSFLFVEM